MYSEIEFPSRKGSAPSHPLHDEPRRPRGGINLVYGDPQLLSGVSSFTFQKREVPRVEPYRKSGWCKKGSQPL